MAKHPNQPLIIDSEGVIRFKKNLIVEALLDNASLRRPRVMDMNEIAAMDFPLEDRIQFAQLIGYSRSGAADLSYMPDSLFDETNEECWKLCVELDQSRK